MTITVTAPSGATIDFPDGTDHDTINVAMLQHMGGTTQTGAAPSDKPLDDTAHAASPLTIARASLAPDPQVQIKRYAEAFNQPVEDFGVVGDHIVRRVPDTGQYARVEPSVSGASSPIDAAKRAFDWVAGGAGPAIPAVTSGLGVAAGTVGGLPGEIAGGAAGASAGEIARQKLDAYLAKNDDEAPIDWGNVALQGAAGAAGPLLGKVAGSVANRVGPVLEQAAADELPAGATAARDLITGSGNSITGNAASFGLSPRVVDALKEHIAGKESELAQLRQDAQSLGVDLSLGQLTGSEAVKQSERQLLRQPETVQSVVDLRNAQNTKQIPDAVKGLMDEIAPETSRGQAVADFRDAAGDVIDKQFADQSAKARPVYAAALDDKPPFWSDDLAPIMQRPSMQAGWKEAQKDAAEEGRTLPEMFVKDADGNMTLDTTKVPDWRDWQNIKIGLGKAIDAGTDPTTGKMTPDAKRILNTKNDLMRVLYQANPEWKAADIAYGSASDVTDAVLNGGVGFLNKMSGPDRQNMVNRVFSGQNLMPDDITAMRRQFAYAGKSDDWNGGVRSYIADKLADAVAPLKQGGEPSNVAGSLYKLFEDRQADVLKAALGGDANDVLIAQWNKLGRVLKAASNQLPEGSATATDTAAPGLARRGVQALTYMLKPASMGADLLDGLSKMQDPANARKLADTLLTPTGDKLLKALYPTTPGTAKANSILGMMLTQAGIVEAEDRAAR